MMMMVMMMNCFVVWLTDKRRLAIFPAGTIVKDPHHRESSTHCEQDLNLRKTWDQASLNKLYSSDNYYTTSSLKFLAIATQKYSIVNT